MGIFSFLLNKYLLSFPRIYLLRKFYMKSTEDQISALLNKGTSEVIVKKELEKKLHSSKKLNVKFGIDPSGKDLHIGHMVVVKKLKEFQELSHNIQLLFGNFTGQIGDPGGKLDSREPKTQKELEKNAEKYIEQVKPVLDTSRINVVWNADWLAPLKFADIVKLSSNFTVMQMLERDMYQNRIERKRPILMHEFLYPLMQGYDSVALKADVELGGTDQTFNLLAGRTIQKAYGQKPQDVLTVPILEGIDGSLKMGKSEDNYIGVTESPKEMYGKTMSIPDDLILRYFELATDVSLEDLKDIGSDLKKGKNPRDLKMRLARELVTIYHDSEAADKAEKEFIEIFQKKGRPDEIDIYKSDKKEWKLIDLLSETGLVSSKSEARRLIQGGGVRVDEKKVSNIDEVLKLSNKEVLLQVGKRKFLKVKGGS